MVDGKAVAVKTRVRAGQVEVELDGGIRVAISGRTPTGAPLTVGSDGVIEVTTLDNVTVVATGMGPGSRYGLVMFSEPVTIGSGVADADGNISATADIPSSTPSGRHTLQLNGTDASGKVVSVSTALRVRGEESSVFNTIVLAVLVLALCVAVAIPATLRRRRR